MPRHHPIDLRNNFCFLESAQKSRAHMTGPGRGPEGIKKKWHDYFSCEKKQWLEGKRRQEPSIHP